MKRPFERNPNLPVAPFTTTLLQNKKNKPINNKPMSLKNNLPNNPIHTPPKCLVKDIQIILEDKQNQNKTEDETKSTEEDEDCLLFTSPMPCTKINAQLADYKQEIIEYVKKRQETFRIDPAYLRSHQLLTPKMRRYLVRHLFKIYRRFQLQRSTLHLAVHYMDMYFSRKNQFKDQLQTVSIAQACLFIAMKYEEIYPPELGEWIDRKYRYEIFKLEGDVLKTLDYQLAHYTIENFMSLHIWQTEGYSENSERQQANVVMLLLMDLTLFDLNIRQCKYSELAECIYGVTNGVCESKLQKEVVRKVKWMVERNQQTIEWFSQYSYYDVVLANLD